MGEVFRTVQREYHLPVGDFPNIEHFRSCIKDYDFSKFPKLDIACVARREGRGGAFEWERVQGQAPNGNGRRIRTQGVVLTQPLPFFFPLFTA